MAHAVSLFVLKITCGIGRKTLFTWGKTPCEIHLHLHTLVSDGCFYANSMFPVAPWIDTKALEQLFRCYAGHCFHRKPECD